MTLRPEELVRKAVAAGYGNPVPSSPSAVHEDDTSVLAILEDTFDFGDWVVVHETSAGHLRARKATLDGDPGTLGVVQHHGESGQWAKVKTAGVCLAKVNKDADVEMGDLLSLKSGSSEAVALLGEFACGRFLSRIPGEDVVAWVAIGATQTRISVHHHTDQKNTQVTDFTSATSLTAPVWHILKVNDINFTGDPDPRLMVALGGGTSHGESPKEGWGWAGVIGSAGNMGFGQIGGNEASGNQGVLGAETAKSSEGINYRINVRSWAGFNAHDRYGLAAPVVAPIRFSWCAGEVAPKWYVRDGCDCITGVTPSEPCDAATLWWSGTMKLDPTINPAGLTSTNWNKQWTPQLAVERNCCESAYAAVTPPDFPCTIFTNPSTLEANAHDVAGAYEGIIPFGYLYCTGRLDTVAAACYHATQLQALWRTIMGLTGVVSQYFACADAHFVALGRTACCPTLTPATVPTVSGGPGATTCEGTACDD